MAPTFKTKITLSFINSLLAFVPACGDASEQQPAPPPKVKMPLLYMQGTKDSAVELCCNTAQKSVVGPLTAAWKLGAKTVVAKGTGYEQTCYTGPGGALLEVLTHDYVATSTVLAGHCYLGSKDVTPSITGQLFGFACTGKNPIHWGEIAMMFFVAHPKP